MAARHLRQAMASAASDLGRLLLFRQLACRRCRTVRMTVRNLRKLRHLACWHASCLCGICGKQAAGSKLPEPQTLDPKPYNTGSAASKAVQKSLLQKPEAYDWHAGSPAQLPCGWWAGSVHRVPRVPLREHGACQTLVARRCVQCPLRLPTRGGWVFIFTSTIHGLRSHWGGGAFSARAISLRQTGCCPALAH